MHAYGKIDLTHLPTLGLALIELFPCGPGRIVAHGGVYERVVV